MFGGSKRKEMIKMRRNKKYHMGWCTSGVEKRMSTYNYLIVKHMEYVT